MLELISQSAFMATGVPARSLRHCEGLLSHLPTRRRTGLINLVAGGAVLVCLSPVGDRLPDKPVGVRAAIELIDKRFAGNWVKPDDAGGRVVTRRP
jgi:hypothetical protein